ncbi:MAG: hypothetical protein QXT73_02690 [Candidatus Methanomethylicaceae archaeon]
MTIKLKNLFYRLIQWINTCLKEGSPDEEASHIKSTLRENFELWQKWEKDFSDSIRGFQDTLDKATMAARQRGIPHPENVGLIKQASREIKNIPSKKMLQKRQPLDLAFEMHIHDQKQKTPTTVIKMLEEYRALLEQERQAYQNIQQRLCLIITLLEEVPWGEPWTENLSVQLLLEHPEIYETMLRIEQLRWNNQMLCYKRLHNSLKNRLIIAERWLMLIKIKLTNYDFRLKKRRLSELYNEFIKINGQNINHLKKLHERLDTILLRMNRQSLIKISSKKSE